jgi:hypothetical protein
LTWLFRVGDEDGRVSLTCQSTGFYEEPPIAPTGSDPSCPPMESLEFCTPGAPPTPCSGPACPTPTKCPPCKPIS